MNRLVELSLEDKNKRDHSLDFVKGWLIYLITLSHMVQTFVYPKSLDAFLENGIVKVINIFDMPMFMLVSGYVAYSSIQRQTWRKNAFRRLEQLILPSATWAVIVAIALLGWVSCNSDGTFLSILPRKFLGMFWNTYWYLWALFFSNITIKALQSHNMDGALGLITLSILVAIIPLNRYFPAAGLYTAKMTQYIFPFYCIGHYLSRTKMTILSNKSYITIATTAFVLVYIFWERNTFIYTDTKDIISVGIMATALRIIGGISLSYILYILFTTAFKQRYITNYIKTVFCNFGKTSLPIYILQLQIFPLLLFFTQYHPKITTAFESNVWICIGMWAVFSIATFMLCNIIKATANHLSQCCPWIARICWGQRIFRTDPSGMPNSAA